MKVWVEWSPEFNHRGPTPIEWSKLLEQGRDIKEPASGRTPAYRKTHKVSAALQLLLLRDIAALFSDVRQFEKSSAFLEQHRLGALADFAGGI